MNSIKANVVKIQRFSTHDGPGVRTVVFLKGCPLRCQWCHNPESQSSHNQIMFQKNFCIGCQSCMTVCSQQAHIFNAIGVHSFDASRCTGCGKCADVCVTNALENTGKIMNVKEILKAVERDCAFYGNTGGITLSGGEPMFQPEASLALLRSAKIGGLSTAIETCGYFDKIYIEELCSVTDYIMWDLKDGVSERHKTYTGIDNQKILSNLFKVDQMAKHILLRCIMVRGVNIDSANLGVISDVYHKMQHCDGVELMPYHAYGGSKAEQLGRKDNGNIAWIPTEDDMAFAKSFLSNKKIISI